jgi:aryl-alcohol dehydrogenase-like predicted oxidoreductase
LSRLVRSVRSARVWVPWPALRLLGQQFRRQLDVNFWDTADVYGAGQSETRIGGFADRNGVYVATKLGRGPQFEGMTRYSKDRVKDSLAGSIKRLRIETLDLAQLHCIPIDVLRDGEIFTWLDDLRDAGMIRHWGASVETIEQSLLAMRSPNCTVLQTIFNLFRQDAVDSLFPAAQKNNVGIIVRLPLASGLLSGKMSKHTTFTPQDHRVFNRDGQSFFVGETFSGLPFEKGPAQPGSRTLCQGSRLPPCPLAEHASPAPTVRCRVKADPRQPAATAGHDSTETLAGEQ